MEPNIYAPPKDVPLGPKEYQATVHLPSRSVPWGIKFATMIASVGSAAVTVWGLALNFAAGGAGTSLTLTGHVVFLTFGSLIGLAIAIAIIAVSTVTPVQHSRLILPYLSAGMSALLALWCLWFVGWIFFSGPRELMDQLFR